MISMCFPMGLLDFGDQEYGIAYCRVKGATRVAKNWQCKFEHKVVMKEESNDTIYRAFVK